MNIIPNPKNIKLNAHSFDSIGKLFINPAFKSEIDMFLLYFKIKKTDIQNDANIFFIKNNNIDSSEGYVITVKPDEIKIEASHPSGAFYAIQTLIQVLTLDSGKIKSPCFVITDEPSFKWRGSMIDVSRNFMSIKFLKKYLDLLALHKINKFHWHLTDDQGWRIEITKYPELTRIGSKRHINTVKSELKGDFYTKDDIKEIIQYALERHIEIIPEIDIPGHSTAAIASIKELSCIDEELNVATTWGIHNKTLCAGKEFVFEWLDDVIHEITDIFPGNYIHLGGDEASKEYWEKCPLCLERMKLEGLENSKELQSYFIKRTADIITKYGKKVLGWEEVLEGGLADDITVFSWQGVNAGIVSANKGHDVIMCPNQSACYFDHKHLDDADEPGWLGVCTVKDTWSFNPIPNGITKDAKKHILGLQGNIWTELIEYPKTLEYMVFPRLTALSETMWCGTDNRDWDDFKIRLNNFKKLLDEREVNYYRGKLE